jgi:hypothetical protein
MDTLMEELLTRLEEVNSRAVDSSDPALHEVVNTVQVLELIRERGLLIEQLKPELAARAPVSYIEWNRLVIIHHQGARILENLKQVRSQVALELGANSSGRVFLQRVTSLLSPMPNRS